MKKNIIITLAIGLALSLGTSAHAITIQELQAQIISLQAQLSALSAQSLSMSIKVVPNVDDVVGTWDVFSPGKGRKGDAPDWRWDFTFKNKGIQTRTIKKITIFHESTGEGWSTDRERMYDMMNGYPLLVKGNRVLNTMYMSDIDLNVLPDQTVTIQTYGQSEGYPYQEVTAQVFFADGKKISVRVPTSNTAVVLDF